MIVVDSSALLAILLEEPDADSFLAKLESEAEAVISAVNAYETAIVLRMRQGNRAVEAFWQLMTNTTIEIRAFDERHFLAALAAYARFGKGVDPKARLNLCDCAACALARTLDAPLLFKGEDFPHTDVARCV